MKSTSIINFLLILFLSLIFTAGCCRMPPSGKPVQTTTLANNILADPVQYNLTAPENIVLKAQNTPLLVTPIAGFKVTAKVKSKCKYFWDWTSEIGPYDLALAWGNLTKPDVDKHIKYSQGNRWYFFRYDSQCPVPESYISDHSANMHIIPASDNIKRVIDKVNVNDTVHLEGYLVNINGTINGRQVWWNSSTTRQDRGDHSCELFYVNSVILNNIAYNKY